METGFSLIALISDNAIRQEFCSQRKDIFLKNVLIILYMMK